MQSVKADNSKIANNTFLLYTRMLIVLLVSLYTSRIVLNTLGVSDFGTFNVISGFVSIFGFIESTLSSSMSRFYNFEGGVRGKSGVLEVYSTGLIVNLIICIVIGMLLETAGLWYIDNVMVIPGERIQYAKAVFHFSVASLLFLFLSIPYSSLILSYEDMGSYAIISLVNVFIKLVLVISLQYVTFDKLFAFGAINLIISAVTTLIYFIVVKCKFNFIRFSIPDDWSTFKSFSSFSGWNLFGSFIFLLKGQGLNMLLNAFFGTVVNAARGIAFQVQGAVYGFSSNIFTAFRPQVVDAYSKQEYNRVRKLFYTESTIYFCLILILVLPLIIETEYVLKIWLGVVPEHSVAFTRLALVDLLIGTLNTPITQVSFATGRIKYYQLFSSTINAALIPICWISLKAGMDSTSVFYWTIAITIMNQVACMLSLAQTFEYGIKQYIKTVLLPLLLLSILVPAIPFAIHQGMNPSFTRFALVCLSELLLSAFLSYYIILKRNISVIFEILKTRHAKS